MDTLNTQSNINDNHKPQSGEKGYEREQIPNSPFWIIGEPEGGYAAVMANYQLTNKMQTKDDIRKAIEENHWEIIMRMIAIVIEKINKEQEEEKMIKNKQYADNSLKMKTASQATTNPPTP